MLRFGFLFFAVLIQVALALPADAAKRVALVIGNVRPIRRPERWRTR